MSEASEVSEVSLSPPQEIPENRRPNLAILAIVKISYNLSSGPGLGLPPPFLRSGTR